MEKSKLVGFIKRYHLNTKVESVVIKVDSDKVSTRFATDTKKLMGLVTYKNVKLDVPESYDLAVYKTSTLLKMLNVLDDADIKLNVQKQGDVNTSMTFSDDINLVKMGLSSLDVIKEAPSLKMEPEYELEINITDEFVNKYAKAYSAMDNMQLCTITANADGVNMIIDDPDNANSNKIVLQMDADKHSEIPDILFLLDLFNSVFVVNKGTAGKLYVSSKGLAKLEYNTDDYHSVYYFVKISK